MITFTLPVWFAIYVIVGLYITAGLQIFILIMEFLNKRHKVKLDKKIDKLYKDAGYVPKGGK